MIPWNRLSTNASTNSRISVGGHVFRPERRPSVRLCTRHAGRKANITEHSAGREVPRHTGANPPLSGRLRLRLRPMSIDRAALVAGSIRLASGISFLVDPVRANRIWGDPDEPAATARLLLRSMGYRDALIGGLLATAALRGRDTRGWFLASGGADAADLLGGVSCPPRDEALTTAHRPRRRRHRHRRRALGRDTPTHTGRDPATQRQDP